MSPKFIKTWHGSGNWSAMVNDTHQSGKKINREKRQLEIFGREMCTLYYFKFIL